MPFAGAELVKVFERVDLLCIELNAILLSFSGRCLHHPSPGQGFVLDDDLGLSLGWPLGLGCGVFRCI